MNRIQAVNYQHIGRQRAVALVRGSGIALPAGRTVPRPGYEVRIWADQLCRMYVRNDGGKFVLYHVELP